MDAALFAVTAGLATAWATVRQLTYDSRKPLGASERRKIRKAKIQSQRADLRRDKARKRRSRLAELTRRADDEGADSLTQGEAAAARSVRRQLVPARPEGIACLRVVCL